VTADARITISSRLVDGGGGGGGAAVAGRTVWSFLGLPGAADRYRALESTI
jgi:hypothetical protein